jgi:hypothetical protein
MCGVIPVLLPYGLNCVESDSVFRIKALVVVRRKIVK